MWIGDRAHRILPGSGPEPEPELRVPTRTIPEFGFWSSPGSGPEILGPDGL
jgi:hypothetical protein